MARGVFFDDYEDFKRISEKVESEQAEFVACWPPPEDPKKRSEPGSAGVILRDYPACKKD